MMAETVSRLTLSTRITESEWTSHLAKTADANLFQSWSFGNAMEEAEGQTALRFAILADGHCVGLLQGFLQQRFGAIGLVRVLRGPVFAYPAPAEIHMRVLRMVKALYPLRHLKWMTAMPELSVEAGPQIRAGGWTRIFEGYETAWLCLDRDPEHLRAGLDGKWRNQLVRAEKSGLEVSVADDPVPVLARYEKERRQRGYPGPSGPLLTALPVKETLSLVAGDPGNPLAAVFFTLHGRNATYQASWTTAEGRTQNAHNLLLWNGIMRLSRHGVLRLDLGGLDARRLPGITHFKRGLGGVSFESAGVFL